MFVNGGAFDSLSLGARLACFCFFFKPHGDCRAIVTVQSESNVRGGLCSDFGRFVSCCSPTFKSYLTPEQLIH